MYTVTTYGECHGRKVTRHATLNGARKHVRDNRICRLIGEWKPANGQRPLRYFDHEGHLYAEVVYTDDRAQRHARQIRFMERMAKAVDGVFDRQRDCIRVPTKQAEEVIDALGWKLHRGQKRNKVWCRNNEWFIAVYKDKIVFISEMEDPAYTSVMDNRWCGRKYHAVLDRQVHNMMPEYIYQMAADLYEYEYASVADVEEALEMMNNDGSWRVVRTMAGGGR